MHLDGFDVDSDQGELEVEVGVEKNLLLRESCLKEIYK
jgi:hypothetical protein